MRGRVVWGEGRRGGSGRSGAVTGGAFATKECPRQRFANARGFVFLWFLFMQRRRHTWKTMYMVVMGQEYVRRGTPPFVRIHRVIRYISS